MKIFTDEEDRLLTMLVIREGTRWNKVTLLFNDISGQDSRKSPESLRSRHKRIMNCSKKKIVYLPFKVGDEMRTEEVDVRKETLLSNRFLGTEKWMKDLGMWAWD